MKIIYAIFLLYTLLPIRPFVRPASSRQSAHHVLCVNSTQKALRKLRTALPQLLLSHYLLLYHTQIAQQVAGTEYGDRCNNVLTKAINRSLFSGRCGRTVAASCSRRWVKCTWRLRVIMTDGSNYRKKENYQQHVHSENEEIHQRFISILNKSRQTIYLGKLLAQSSQRAMRLIGGIFHRTNCCPCCNSPSPTQEQCR